MGNALYYVLLLILVTSAWLRQRGDSSKEIRNALTWVIIASVLVLGWSLLH